MFTFGLSAQQRNQENSKVLALIQNDQMHTARLKQKLMVVLQRMYRLMTVVVYCINVYDLLRTDLLSAFTILITLNI